MILRNTNTLLVLLILIFQTHVKQINATAKAFFSDRCTTHHRNQLNRYSGTITTRKYPNTSLQLKDINQERDASRSAYNEKYIDLTCVWEINLPDKDSHIFIRLMDFDFAKDKLLYKRPTEPSCYQGYLRIQELTSISRKSSEIYENICIEDTSKIRKFENTPLEINSYSILITLNMKLKLQEVNQDIYKVGKGFAMSYFSKKIDVLPNQMTTSSILVSDQIKVKISGDNESNGSYGNYPTHGQNQYHNMLNNMLVTCDIKGKDGTVMNYITDSINPCLNLICPAGCGYVAWDDDIITSDGHYYNSESRLCRAAVHAGSIKDRDGGYVTMCGSSAIDTHRAFYSNDLLSRGREIQNRNGYHNKPSFYFKGFQPNNCFNQILSIIWTASSYQNRDFSPSSADYRKFSAWQPNNNDVNAWIRLELDGFYNVTQISIKGLDNTGGYITGFRMQVFNDTSLTDSDLDEVNSMDLPFENRKWHYLMPELGYIKKHSKAKFINVEDYKGKDARFSFYDPFPVFCNIRILVEDMKQQRNRALKIKLKGCKVGKVDSKIPLITVVDTPFPPSETDIFVAGENDQDSATETETEWVMQTTHVMPTWVMEEENSMDSAKILDIIRTEPKWVLVILALFVILMVLFLALCVCYICRKYEQTKGSSKAPTFRNEANYQQSIGSTGAGKCDIVARKKTPKSRNSTPKLPSSLQKTPT